MMGPTAGRLSVPRTGGQPSRASRRSSKYSQQSKSVARLTAAPRPTPYLIARRGMCPSWPDSPAVLHRRSASWARCHTGRVIALLIFEHSRRQRVGRGDSLHKVTMGFEAQPGVESKRGDIVGADVQQNLATPLLEERGDHRAGHPSAQPLPACGWLREDVADDADADAGRDGVGSGDGHQAPIRAAYARVDATHELGGVVARSAAGVERSQLLRIVQPHDALDAGGPERGGRDDHAAHRLDLGEIVPAGELGQCL